MESDNETAELAGLETHVAEIVSSYLSRNQIATADLPKLITTVYESLQSVGKPVQAEPIRTPAVSLRQSVTRDYVVCLECGWRGNMLRRHIMARHELSADEYRARWNLSREHLLVAPGYSEKRSGLAKELGLGKRARSAAATAGSTTE
jgi:MucR family transcriptional regulator, transcriptional regulator of exopolysaccharide biosynthesis